MKVLKAAKIIFISTVTAGIFAVIAVGCGIPSLIGRIICFSAAVTAPDGICGWFESNSLFWNSIPVSKERSAEISVSHAEAETKAVTAAVEETVIGNIVKKTLSPYGANTSYSNVYINNQCGEEIDIGSALSAPLPYTVTKSEEPQILIYHTHTTESFMIDESAYYTDSDEPRSTDPARNIVAIGDRLAKQLENAGYKVIHDSTVHDHPGFSGSYDRSAETVLAVLAEHPSIKIAIDVHRDSISGSGSDKVAPVVNIGGKDAAQVMLVMGSETGSITGYPEWKTNLALAERLQNVFETDYPQFARSILLRSAKYNQNITTGSILIEIGSDANTFDEALYSAELVGKSLVSLLDSLQEN